MNQELNELKKVVKELKETNYLLIKIMWNTLFGICMVCSFLARGTLISVLLGIIAVYIAFTKFKEKEK